jgi:hypothetical protein
LKIKNNKAILIFIRTSNRDEKSQTKKAIKIKINHRIKKNNELIAYAH